MQGEDEEIRPIPHSGKMENLRSSQTKGMETARLDGRWGKNKITLGREDLRKSKPEILDGEEYRKPIAEYKKPKPLTLDGEHRKSKKQSKLLGWIGAQETHH